MIQVQRTQTVLNYLAQNNVLTVEEAVKLFQSSPATVRRDFNHLAEEKLVRRVRGGVELIQPGPTEMAPVELRTVQNADEKRALAAKAAELLRPGDVVIVDGGTTTSMLARVIPGFPLRIITNSVRLVSALDANQNEHPLLEIYVTGGILYPHSGLLLGPSAQAGVSQYHAQWAFLSVGGVTERGLYNTNELVVGTERAMMESADKVVILADSSKIGRHALCAGAGLEQIDILITGECAENQPTLQKIEDAGVKVITVAPPEHE